MLSNFLNFVVLITFATQTGYLSLMIVLEEMENGNEEN